MSINIRKGVPGIREIREIAPIDNASPKIRSERDSIRGLGRLMTSPKFESQLKMIHRSKVLCCPVKDCFRDSNHKANRQLNTIVLDFDLLEKVHMIEIETD